MRANFECFGYFWMMDYLLAGVWGSLGYLSKLYEKLEMDQQIYKTNKFRIIQQNRHPLPIII
jgi:hypothetical protein